MIDVTKYTAHKSPGKFEGESAATEYFYEQALNGDGETIHEDIDDGEGSTADLFQIDVEEAEAFDLPLHHWFLLREDSQGFAIGSVHETREAAEERFMQWCGR
jgi:hypothetical protein